MMQQLTWLGYGSLQVSPHRPLQSHRSKWGLRWHCRIPIGPTCGYYITFRHYKLTNNTLLCSEWILSLYLHTNNNRYRKWHSGGEEREFNMSSLRGGHAGGWFTSECSHETWNPSVWHVPYQRCLFAAFLRDTPTLFSWPGQLSRMMGYSVSGRARRAARDWNVSLVLLKYCKEKKVLKKKNG